MSPLLRIVLAATLCAMAAAPASAQAPAAYRVTSDTLRYVTSNPFRMYWLAGTDTIGDPRRNRSVEAHVWLASAEHPTLEVRQVPLDLEQVAKVDTFTLTPSGQVIEVNHRPPTSAQRVDLLLRLPQVPMPVGTRWSDTLRNEGTDPAGPQWYEVIRSYQVARLVDTLGARGVAEVAATGRIRFRFGYWADSAAGRVAWIDVEGPVTESYLFDLERGRLLRREWDMHLRGHGVAPSGTDTLPAGLRSGETLAITDLPGARFLLARSAGPDTSVTLDVQRGAPILLHTVDRRAGRIAASMGRGDGMSGIAVATFTGGDLLDHEATWTDSTLALTTTRVARRGTELVVSRDGRDSTRHAPSGRWAVADHAMPELLAPMLLALPRDQQAHEFEVFRPYPGQWDSGMAVAADRGGVVLVVIQYAGVPGQEVLVFTPEGDLLFGEVSGASQSRRVAVGAERQARLQAALSALRGGG